MAPWRRGPFRRGRHALAAVSFALGLLVAVPGAVAQPDPAQDMPPRPGDMTPFQLQQLFDAMIVMQAQETLSLSESQYAQFLTRLKVLQDTRRRNQRERARLLNELHRLTAARALRPGAAEGEVKERLAALQELESRSAAETRKAYGAIDEVLDVFQQARFRVFEEQIERRKLELIGRARQAPNSNRKVPPLRPPR